MFCVIPMPLHSPLINLEANFGSLSLMNFSGRPNCGNICCIMSPAVSSAIIPSLHGMNIVAFVQSWSVMVSIELYPCETGSLVMKSSTTVSNSIASCFGKIGTSGTLVGHVLILFLWQSAHPLTYSITSCHMFGHQYCQLVSRYVLLILGCLYTGVSWWACMKNRLCSALPVTTLRLSLYHTPSIFFSWWASIHGFSKFSSCLYTGSVGSISS